MRIAITVLSILLTCAATSALILNQRLAGSAKHLAKVTDESASIRDGQKAVSNELDAALNEIKELKDSEGRAREIVMLLQKKLESIEATNHSRAFSTDTRKLSIPEPTIKKESGKEIFVFPIVAGKNGQRLLDDAELRHIDGTRFIFKTKDGFNPIQAADLHPDILTAIGFNLVKASEKELEIAARRAAQRQADGIAALQRAEHRAEANQKWAEQNAKIQALQAQADTERVRQMNQQAEAILRQKQMIAETQTELSRARAIQKSADAELIRSLRW